MANEIRTRTNFVAGLVEDNPLTSGATTLTSAGLASLPVIDTTNHAALILDPDAVAGNPEIVYVTAHTASATTATILRAQENTTARQHDRDTPWVHTSTAREYNSLAFRAYRSGTQSFSASTTTLVQFNAETFDWVSSFDSTTNFRYTASTAGLYYFGSAIEFEGASSDWCTLAFFKNGGEYSSSSQFPAGATSDFKGVNHHDIVHLVSGDYVDTRIYAKSGPSPTIHSGSSKAFFYGYKVDG